ncbi:MAG: hypothetical protein M1812_001313 [Candelaria pacifica]|nr:MAG: hypothetical protein M1812_001313 [Candelaria pacifica]
MAEYLNQRVYQPPKGEDAHKHEIDSPLNPFTEEARRKAEQILTSQHKVFSTNRDEAAPRPASRDKATIHTSKQRPYIEPATPFLPGYPTASRKNVFKNRAVTEPIRESATVAPLFSSPTKKSAQPKKSRSSKDNKELPALPPTTSAKAAAVLGEPISQAPSANKAPPTTPSASAPATTVKFNRGSSNTDFYVPGNTRQVKSQPGPPAFFNEHTRGQPTSRFQLENRPRDQYEIPSPPQFDTPTPPPPPPKPGAMILGDGRMSPTRGGTYGRLGNVNVMPPPPRMDSMIGAIEHTGNIEGQPPSQYYQPSGLGLGYSPSVYGNGFEDPPPTAALHPYSSNTVFDDQQRQTSGDSHSLNISQNSQASKMTLPFVFNGHQSELTPTDSNATSGPQTAIPTFHSPIPQTHTSGNSVPPHPSWIPSLRTAEADQLAHHILGLHYQIGHETGTLNRKIDNKHDILVDHVIGRYENAQAIQAEYQNDLRQGLSAVEHNLGRVVGEVRFLEGRFEEEGSASIEGLEATLEKLVRMGEVVMEKLDGLTEKIAVVEKKVESGSCGCANAKLSAVPSTVGSLKLQQQIQQQQQQQQQQQHFQQTPDLAVLHENQAYYTPNPQVNPATATTTVPNYSSPQKHVHQKHNQQQQIQHQNTSQPTASHDNRQQRYHSPERKPPTPFRPQESPDLRLHPAFAGFAFAEPARPTGTGNDGGDKKGLISQGHWYQQLYERGI